MSNLVDKLLDFQRHIAAQKGDFHVFALVMRDAESARWDLVVSAAWLQEPGRPGVDAISQFLSNALTSDELLELGRVVVLSQDNPLVKALGSLRMDSKVQRYVGLRVDSFQFDLAVVFNTHLASLHAHPN